MPRSFLPSTIYNVEIQEKKNCGHTVLTFYVGRARGWASKMCPRIELLFLILEYFLNFQ